MLSVEEAQERVLAGIAVLDVESAPLEDCLDRVLAQDAVADIDMPPFTNSSMDGYAVRAADTTGASAEHPCRLPVSGTIAAGDSGETALLQGTVLRIMTGAPLPIGADAVIPVEQTRPAGASVDFLAAATAGDYVRLAGQDAARGRRILAAGTAIQPGEIGLLASQGYASVPVYRRARVAILSTGDELVDIDRVPGPGQIRNSNALMLAAQVRRCGAVPVSLGIARDTRDAVHAALDAGKGCDLYLSSGGVSVGDFDVVKTVLEERGQIDAWRVKMRPGKPVTFGRIDGNTPYLGLPGNPVSSFVTFELFARPVLRKLAGHPYLFRQTVSMILDDTISGFHDRRHFVRAVARWEPDGWHAVTTGAQDSHLLSSTVAANALVIIPEGTVGPSAGDRVSALLLDWPESH